MENKKPFFSCDKDSPSGQQNFQIMCGAHICFQTETTVHIEFKGVQRPCSTKVKSLEAKRAYENFYEYETLQFGSPFYMRHIEANFQVKSTAAGVFF